MKKKLYTIYKITNLVNDKIYIGAHATTNVEDDYLGSGVRISQAIEKYGRDSFKKDIIAIFDTPEEMWNAEFEIVNDEFLKKENVYNIHRGGVGGWQIYNENSEIQRSRCRRGNEVQNELAQSDAEWVAKRTKKRREAMLERWQSGDHTLKAPDWTGRKHRTETKVKIGAANKMHQTGCGNSQFGKVWIFNEQERKSIRVHKEEVDSWVSRGWKLGRKMKFHNIENSVKE